MRKLALFFLTLGLLCFAYNAVACEGEDCDKGKTIGISRNPQSCNQCHASHIITYHNENIFSTPKPLNISCYPCHDHVTTITDISCDACHTNHSFGKLKMDRAVGTWSMTGPMAIARFYNSASLLQDGRFMVAGGSTPPAFGATKTVEVLDPVTRMFTTVAPLSVTRVSQMQTTLSDGKVLITGGRPQLFGAPGSVAYNTAEIYDPATNTFMPAGIMNANRRSHRDILLDDGRVLITGGTAALAGDITSVSLNSAEVYDPAAGTFTLVGTMNNPRQSHHLVKLADGKVLVVGGGAGPGLANPLATMEIFDPATNLFTPAASMSNPRMTCAVSLLADGKVLLAFEWNGSVVTPQSELYDPATDTIIPITGSLPFHGKVDNLAVRLYDDTVVIPTGGNANIQVLPDTSVYRPNQDDFVMAGSVQFPRTTGYGTAALLTDGRIVTGGGIGLTAAGSPKFFNNGEIYTPSDLSQAKGLKKVIGDLPKSAFKNKNQKEALKDDVASIIDLLKCAGKQQQAKDRLVQCVIPRFDGCAGGNASDDWIIACNNQAVPYAVAARLLKTLDEILGILKPPVITITAAPTSGDQPLAVSFTATATDPDGTVLSYYWDFGNGANSILQNASNTYTCPGTYTATCAVIDNDGLIAEATVNINVAYPAGVTAQFKCDLLPAYNSFCAKVCHYANAPYNVGAGVNLSSYAAIMAGRTMPDGTIRPIVIPGDPDNSPIEIITGPPRIHAHDVGGERLNDDVKAKQRAWILEGALNN
jgi:hypothetical protein